MKIYITYFSYDNYDYEIWDIHKSRDESIQKLKEKHIPFLIEGKQPDISNLSLVEVEVTEEEYKMLTNNPTEEDLRNYFRNLEDFGVNCDYIYETDGTIGFELVEYYYQSCTDPEEVDDDDFDDVEWSEKLDKLEETNKALDDVIDNLDDFINDGMVDSLEKKSIEVVLQNIQREKVDIDAQFDYWYSNSYLINPLKNEYKTSYDNYITKYNNLVSIIEGIINKDTLVSDTDKQNMLNANKELSNLLFSFISKTNEVIDFGKENDVVTFISGAGSTMLLISKKHLAFNYKDWQIKEVKVLNKGAYIYEK